MILIHCSEDGDHSVEHIAKEVFLENLNDGYYGEDVEFMSQDALKSKNHRDLNTFVGYILIDGDAVVPKPKEVVRKFTL